MSDILVGCCRRRRGDGLVLVASHFRLLLATGTVGRSPWHQNVLGFKLPVEQPSICVNAINVIIKDLTKIGDYFSYAHSSAITLCTSFYCL